ncbi:hypothetical protein L9F63_028307, partial [Diploptera punctata]
IKSRIFVLLFFYVISPGSSARILALFPYVGKSHFVMFEPYIKELASRGHQVVVVSHFPQKQPVPNLKDVSLVGSIDIDPTDRLDVSKISGFKGIKTAAEELTKELLSCDKKLSYQSVQNLIH